MSFTLEKDYKIMFGSNFKMAWSMLRSAKWRTAITMLGVIIGVVSVATILSLGNGVKKQVSSHLNKAGPDLITVRPGNPFQLDKNGQVSRIDSSYSYGFGAGSLSDKDLKAVRGTTNVGQVAPINFVSGSAKTENKEYLGGFIIGTEENFPSLIGHKIDYGSFFKSDEYTLNTAIIGQTVASQLFESDIPLGRGLSLRGQNFVVGGVFEQFEPNTLAIGVDLNKAIFIPYSLSQEISAGRGQLAQILAKPINPTQLGEVSAKLKDNLTKLHAGQSDLIVFNKNESLAVSSRAVNSATQLVGGVAALALLAGGIGIMNIMLLSVTERTREIGIRKAVGATNRQLLGQFWLESIILSFTGGVLGILISVLAVYLLRIFTDLKPVISLGSLSIACLSAVAVGIVFGLLPAVKAARKDPIDALRYDL